MQPQLNYTKLTHRDVVLLYVIFASCSPAKFYHNEILNEKKAKQTLSLAINLIQACVNTLKNVSEIASQFKSSPHDLCFYDNVETKYKIIQSVDEYKLMMEVLTHTNLKEYLNNCLNEKVASAIYQEIKGLNLRLASTQQF